MSGTCNLPPGISENILGVSGDRGKAEDSQMGHALETVLKTKHYA